TVEIPRANISTPAGVLPHHARGGVRTLSARRNRAPKCGPARGSERPSALDHKYLNHHMKIARFRRVLGWRAGLESAKHFQTLAHGILSWPTTTTSSRKRPARPIFAPSPSPRR